MNSDVDFAILAPVPEEHLISGLEVLKQEEHVAFGTRKWELFRHVEALCGGEPVPVLIYPSVEDDSPKLSYLVKWIGWYDGYEESDDGRYRFPECRPKSTEKYAGDQSGYWAGFWRVKRLQKLEESGFRPISSLQSHKSGKFWKKGSPPRGPEIVQRPEWI